MIQLLEVMRKPLNVEIEKLIQFALDQLAKSVHGYAYAFQTLGYYTWKESQSSQEIDDVVVQKAIELSKQDLFRNAYEKMYTDLSDKDREFINVIVDQNVDDLKNRLYFL